VNLVPDLLMTLCQSAGAKVPDDRTLDGVSMLPMFEGERLSSQRPCSLSIRFVHKEAEFLQAFLDR